LLCIVAVGLLLTSYQYLISFTLFNSPHKTFLGTVYVEEKKPVYNYPHNRDRDPTRQQQSVYKQGSAVWGGGN
jgi:hypothetical protein